MNCHNARELLAQYAIGALSETECLEVDSHLLTGCADCRQELDELIAASSLLAESVFPVPTRSGLKQELLSRIETGQPTTRSCSEDFANDDEQSLQWGKGLLYLAAMLACVIAGTWIAQLSEPSHADINRHQLAGKRQARDEWQQRIADATRRFGESRFQLTGFQSSAEHKSFQVAIFCDKLANQLHIVATGVSPSAEQRQLWLWLLNGEGKQLVQCSLKPTGKASAAGLLSLPSLPPRMMDEVSELIVTEEALGEQKSPSGPVVGKAKILRAL